MVVLFVAICLSCLFKGLRSFHLRVQGTEVTEDVHLFTPFDEALQRDMDRAEDSPDGGIVDQLRDGFLLFVFRFVFGGARFDWRLKNILQTGDYQPILLILAAKKCSHRADVTRSGESEPVETRDSQVKD